MTPVRRPERLDLVRALDLAVGVGLGAWAVAATAVDDGAVLLVLAAAAMTFPLLARRTRPVLAAGVMAAVMTAQALVTEPPEQVWLLIAVIVASYSLGAFERRVHLSLIGLTALAAAVSIGIARDSTDTLGNIPPTLLIFIVAPWGAGRAVHRSDRHARRLTAEVDSLTRERELLAREAVAQERTRIARELHDVVAHSLSVIAIQADAAEGSLVKDPALAREPLGAIKSTAREALGEMRHLLGLLREDSDSPSLQPPPGLHSVDALARQVRAAGLEVEVVRRGAERPLPAGADLSAYRVIQEALTNTLKHAGATRATVRVEHLADRVEIEVSDDGRGAGASAGDTGSGHGLIGMRERVSMYGGTIDAGPAEGGGFRLNVSLPR